MSSEKIKSGKTRNFYENNCSWNSCEDIIRECIERNRFVQNTRSRLAKKKIKKLKNIKGLPA